MPRRFFPPARRCASQELHSLRRVGLALQRLGNTGPESDDAREALRRLLLNEKIIMHPQPDGSWRGKSAALPLRLGGRTTKPRSGGPTMSALPLIAPRAILVHERAMRAAAPHRDLQAPPSGRLLYKLADGPRYVVVQSGKAGLWIVEDGWTSASRATGPFRATEVLRAVRLANTVVPQGCELGPWQDGIGMFERATLPGQSSDWSVVELGWLEPSLSRYSGADVDKVVNETCCAPPTDPPRVDWAPEPDVEADARAMVASRDPGFRPAVVGVLAREWNAHPCGSPLLAEREDLVGAFAIVDVPPAAG